MELILSSAIGILFGCGVWLILRTRTFQVVIGLSLCAYAVNLFIAATGGLKIGRDPVLKSGPAAPEIYADPLPQALVLTAIVIGFATTALLLVVVMVARGLTGGDHVDGASADAEEQP
jgi:multicomponent K+:H+ antiporter subunit C